jgi:hypothetical protein
MTKHLLIAAVAATVACLLGACAANPNTDGQQLSRADREEPTGSMLPRRRAKGDAQVINKEQIDTNQILNPGAAQPHIKF